MATLLLLTLSTITLGLFLPIPWPLVGRRLGLLAAEVCLLFWSSTLLPGPIKKAQRPNPKVKDERPSEPQRRVPGRTKSKRNGH